MERIRNLHWYQKLILVVMLAMLLVFAVIYPVTLSKVGYQYMDTILVSSTEGNTTVYTGNIDGMQTRITVSKQKTVLFRYGDKTYGPYTVTEDPSAIPEDSQNKHLMRGLEVRRGDELLFRGGVMDSPYWLYNEDGSVYESITAVTYVTSDGVTRDMNGNPVDTLEPTVTAILKLTDGPELTHKGDGSVWFIAAFLCMINAVSILFADELFRMRLSFRVRDAEDLEPSDWEIMGRSIGWTAVTVMTLFLLIKGLQ